MSPFPKQIFQFRHAAKCKLILLLLFLLHVVDDTLPPNAGHSGCHTQHIILQRQGSVVEPSLTSHELRLLLAIENLEFKLVHESWASVHEKWFYCMYSTMACLLLFGI